MAGNIFYGRGAFDERVRFAEAFAADRRTRMRVLMYVAILTPGAVAVYQNLKARNARADERD